MLRQRHIERQIRRSYEAWACLYCQTRISKSRRYRRLTSVDEIYSEERRLLLLDSHNSLSRSTTGENQNQQDCRFLSLTERGGTARERLNEVDGKTFFSLPPQQGKSSINQNWLSSNYRENSRRSEDYNSENSRKRKGILRDENRSERSSIEERSVSDDNNVSREAEGESGCWGGNKRKGILRERDDDNWTILADLKRRPMSMKMNLLSAALKLARNKQCSVNESSEVRSATKEGPDDVAKSPDEKNIQ